MMQAFEAGIESLRRAIRSVFDRKDGSRTEITVTHTLPSRELDRCADGLHGILDRTAADLRRLASADVDAIDARPILDRAMHEFALLGFHSRPEEARIMSRYLQQLPDRDYRILRYFKNGKKHTEIAALMGVSIDSVRRSLATTYAELRVQLMYPSDGDDGGLPSRAPSPPRPFKMPMKQTSARY